jgi:c-di-GMP-binding flagellar brake protein YcgR
MTQERRLHPRVAVHLSGEIQLVNGPTWAPVVVVDLSAGGGAIRCAFELPLRTEIRLRLSLPGATGSEPAAIEANALVVRVFPSTHAAGADRQFTVGLHFLSLDPDDSELLRRFVWSLLIPDDPA